MAIFSAIKKTKKGLKGEIQLTDSIQTLIKGKQKVLGSIMPANDVCIDIGIPETQAQTEIQISKPP